MEQIVYELLPTGFIKEIYVAQVENGEIKDSDKKHFIAIQPTNGLFKPKWTGSTWVEGATQEEINELTKPQPTQPTLEQRIADLENTILTLLEVL